MTSLSLYPSALSAQSDGVTLSANPATFVIGGAAPNKHALIRFDTSGIPDAETLVACSLACKISAKGAGTVPDVALWASDFGVGISNADYGVAENTPTLDRTGLRHPIDRIFLSTDAVATVGTLSVPTQYVTKATGGVLDVELRPYVSSYTGPTVGATDTMTIHGPAAVTATDAPTLTLVSITDAEILAGTYEDTYRSPGLGAESYVAFGIETSRGVAVKPNVFMDLLNSTFDNGANNLVSASLRSDRTAPFKVALGGAVAGGTFSVEATPEKIWRWLLGAFKITSTTSNGSQTGRDGSAYTVYTKTFKVAKNSEIKTFTVVQKSAEQVGRYLYNGCVLDSLSIAGGLDQLIELRGAVAAREEISYDSLSGGTIVADAYLQDSNAGYDLNMPLSFIGVEIERNGVVDRGILQNFSIDISNNARARRGMRRNRTVRSHYVQKLVASVSYEMELDSEYELRRYLGVKHKDFPYRVEKNIIFDTFKVKMEGPLGKDVQEVTVEFPKMLFTAMAKPISGSEMVMLRCQAVGMYDSSSAAGVIINVKSTEAASAYAASTNRVTVWPINRA